ncbi:hypothetical protein [Ectothiorhodospira sp. BSL-9]|uniref:hypothetical protein n=1 Tax=Ectothiorhodospira sp. BSL-9 TaxID=1442136 RepID=UPI001F0AC92E|nr:hypothetical protein [Ectothiorhodospira sp. BSL-9]
MSLARITRLVHLEAGTGQREANHFTDGRLVFHDQDGLFIHGLRSRVSLMSAIRADLCYMMVTKMTGR